MRRRQTMLMDASNLEELGLSRADSTLVMTGVYQIVVTYKPHPDAVPPTAVFPGNWVVLVQTRNGPAPLGNALIEKTAAKVVTELERMGPLGLRRWTEHLVERLRPLNLFVVIAPVHHLPPDTELPAERGGMRTMIRVGSLPSARASNLWTRQTPPALWEWAEVVLGPGFTWPPIS